MRLTLRDRALPALLLAGVFLAAGCRSLDLADPDDRPWPPVEESDLGHMVNVHTAGPIWFGGAPRKADIDLAARRGVRVVVDAATETERPEYDLEKLCRRYDIRVAVLGVDDAGLAEAQVDAFLAVMEKAADEEVLLFCGNGGRSAMLVAIYRAVHVGVPVDEVVREARRAGMKPGDSETFVRDQVDRLRPPLADSGTDGRDAG